MGHSSITPLAALRLRQLALVFTATIALMAVMSAPAFAGGDDSQSCSDTTCKSLINVGDVTINLEGNRILTDNEITLVEGATINVLNNSLNCVQVVAVLSNNCSKDIATAVVVVVKTFDNYVLKTITVTAFGKKYHKKYY